MAPGRRDWLQPHRIVLGLFGIAILASAAILMRWDWLPTYGWMILAGLWQTLVMLVSTAILGFLLAIPLGLAQAAGPWYLAAPAKAFCTVIRGTPLLLQVWLLYYGLGSLFPLIPEIRGSFLWPYLRQAWPYAVLALTFSFAGYEGEVMRGAFAGVPRGELEAGRAYGMRPFTLLRRIWLPRAVQRSLPTLTGETVLQLKSTPLVATITVIDLYAVFGRIRQDTLLTYEPLLLLALIYAMLTGVLIGLFKLLERCMPMR
ncbi:MULTISPECIES: ABC transporter permease [unclassified Aureimonas]|uniref:ABC transporter permease n=1 Tax=unclassified Aureimonas TaxID=2615206 RepID=UPI0006FF5BFF|nr:MULTISPECIES: ABC transporter permease subunit [unclassified Aureimonas]KQT64504.1 ABC transporter permease [Aureimonas sp. Leaf427]KQT81687.1 ABC transporter permease [Aureimonas sp. Leaf460]